MKKITVVLLLAGGFLLASCGTATAHHSRSYNAGVAWVRNGFPGHNDNYCMTSVLQQGANCSQANSMCGSNAAAFAVANGSYNMQQWIDGCLSVPYKKWPQWYRDTIS